MSASLPCLKNLIKIEVLGQSAGPDGTLPVILMPIQAKELHGKVSGIQWEMDIGRSL